MVGLRKKFHDVGHLFFRLSSVMDIFRSRFYRLNATVLTMVGLWPYQKFRSLQVFQQVMCQITVITVMTTQAIKMVEIWSDLDSLIECITPIGVQLGASIKATNCIIQRKQMTKLLETIQKDWSNMKNDKEIEIMSKYAEEGRSLTIIYIAMMSSSTVAYFMIPLLPRFLDVIIPLNESRTPVYLYHTQYYVDPEEYFIWILLHTYSGTVITITTVVAADTMFVCYVLHVCGILAVTGYRLENLTSQCLDSDGGVLIMSKDDDERCRREIVLCIDQHYKALETAKLIESSYSMSYFFQLGVYMFLLSLSAVQLLIKFGQVEEVVRLLGFNLAQFAHLFFNSWPGQKLIDQSINFRESLYAGEWYLLSEGNKHLLRFVMMRTLQPQKITAGKLYDLSMENFSVVIQTSLSYFTVFASI